MSSLGNDLDNALDDLPRYMAVSQPERGWLPGEPGTPTMKACVYVDDVREMLRRKLPNVDPFIGDLAHPGWARYVALNLRDALALVPDTGDWHGALRGWCDRTAPVPTKDPSA